MMTGETDLSTLLRSMQPELNPGVFVFCSLDPQTIPPGAEPICIFYEREGATLILPKTQAEALGLAYSFESAWITLTVHSALEAVGLTAAVSQALAQAGISCNIVAAYYHDHLFVPVGEAQRALDVLAELRLDSALAGNRPVNASAAL